MTRVASFVVLVAIIVAVGVLFWRVMSSFFVPLFLALLLVVMFRPLFEWLLQRMQRPRAAAVTTVAVVTLLVLLPAAWVVSVAVAQGIAVFTHTDVSTVEAQLEKVRRGLGLQMPDHYEEFRQASEELSQLAAWEEGADGTLPSARRLGAVQDDLQQVLQRLLDGGSPISTAQLAAAVEALEAAVEALPDATAYHTALDQAWTSLQNFRVELLGGPMPAWLKQTANPSASELLALKSTGFRFLREWALTISGTTLALAGRLALGGVIVVISLYFFLLDGPGMIKTVMWLSPLDDRHEEELLGEFAKVSRAVVVATLLSAIVQGLLAAVGFWFVGLPSVVLLMLLTTVFAMVPFFGAAAVWLPASMYVYLVEDRLGAALGLAAYGALIVSTSDNLIKPWVLHGQSNLHPLFALLSVLGGVQALGPMGILIGPMVVAFLQTLLRILHRELSAMDSQRRAAEAAASATS